MVNTELISAQSVFLLDMHHTIQVVTYAGHDAYGKRQLSTNPSQTRQYNCLIQPNERTSWTVGTSTDGLPYIAYVLTVPIGGTDAYPIRAEEQITVIHSGNDELDGTVRRMGLVKTFPDQYGNNFVMTVTFE
jgi:hypothetical protein